MAVRQRTPTYSAQLYLDNLRPLRRAIGSSDMRGVMRTVDRLRERFDLAHASITDPKDPDLVYPVFHVDRMIQFLFSTPVSSHAMSHIRRAWPSLDAPGLTGIQDPWERLAVLERRQIRLGELTVQDSFANIPPLLRPVFDAYEHCYSVHAEMLADFSGRRRRLGSVGVVIGAVNEGSKKINRFGEVVARLTVRHDKAGRDGARSAAIYERSPFVRETANELPEAVLACQRVLVGCAEPCYSSSLEEALTGPHKFHLEALLNGPELLAEPLAVFKASHAREVPYDANKFELVDAGHSRFVARPSIDLSAATDPFDGEVIGEQPWGNQFVIGCPAVPMGVVDALLTLHGASFRDAGVWRDIEIEYAKMNLGAPTLTVSPITPAPPMPFSNFDLTGLEPPGIA